MAKGYRLTTVCHIRCSLCDATGNYILSDGRQTVRNQLHKIGWRHIDNAYHFCPSHKFLEIFDFWQKVKPRRKTRKPRK